MAQQDGFGMLKGKVGGFNFYSRNGKHFVGAATGVDRKRYKSDPAFELSRQNNDEFGKAQLYAKAIRMALRTQVWKVQSPSNIAKFGGRLYKNIRTDETNERGKRDLNISTLESNLLGFEFGRDKTFGSVFTEAVTVEARNDGAHRFTIDAHDSTTHVIAPIQATHYRFATFVVYHDPRPNNPYFFNSNRVNSTVRALDAGTVNANVIVNNAPTSVGTPFQTYWIGIQFIEEVNGDYLDLKSEKNDVIAFLSVSTL